MEDNKQRFVAVFGHFSDDIDQDDEMEDDGRTSAAETRNTDATRNTGPIGNTERTETRTAPGNNAEPHAATGVTERTETTRATTTATTASQRAEAQPQPPTAVTPNTAPDNTNTVRRLQFQNSVLQQQLGEI